MFQVLIGTRVLAECGDLQQAAEALLRQNMGAGPRSSKGLVDVRLAWSLWPGFTLEVRSAEDGGIVYSPWLDDVLGGRYGQERVAPTLGYFIDKSAELGIDSRPGRS